MSGEFRQSDRSDWKARYRPVLRVLAVILGVVYLAYGGWYTQIDEEPVWRRGITFVGFFILGGVVLLWGIRGGARK